MPELRKDPIIGRWVIIATERAKRPDDFHGTVEGPSEAKCPFCEGNEKETPPEICIIRPPGQCRPNEPGWEVRCVPSIKPILRIEGNLERRGRGMYDLMNGIGAHEVVIESPQHIDNMADLAIEQINKVFSCYKGRINDLEKDSRFKYVLVFKNYGWSAGGGRVRHARSQLIATPVNPKRVKEELVGSRRYYEYHERCIFCDMLHQELTLRERVIADIDGFLAIAPFASRFPFEVWILPKKHQSDFAKDELNSGYDLAKILKLILSKIKKGLNSPSYNYIIHTAPFKRPKTGYWKTIKEDYHWHIEIMPRLTRVAGFEWGTGFYICPLPPESAAKFLREVEV